MSASQLKQLWDITRENEKTIAVLKQKVDAQDATIKKLEEDNDAMRAILNKAIGARTVFSLIGGLVVAVITWFVTWYSTKGN